MAKVTKEQIERTADLVRIALTEEETALFTDQLNDFLELADQIQELDTDNVKPTTHVLDTKDVMRKDEPKKWITREAALKNAPDADEGQIRVPSIL
jgi:aspartyl-tRNA(Asn)/glutamyl-tRNA(Gln) amidotransferase subunit C